MQIRSVEMYHIKIPLKKNITHHLANYRYSESIVVKITTDKGIAGWGESRPRKYLTGESIETALFTIIELFKKYLVNKNFSSLPEVMAYSKDLNVNKGNLAAYCGLELALLDAAGKSFDISIGEMIGTIIKENKIDQAANIDFDIKMDDIKKICMIIKMRGYRGVKIKVGREDDIERIEIVRRSLGEDILLWIDANGAWGFDEALRKINLMKKHSILLYEQPLAAELIVEMAELRKKTNIKIIADESLCSIEDALQLIKYQACDVFNLRIGKCGGILRVLDLINIAKEKKIECQMGTLVGETGILLSSLKLLLDRIKGISIVEGLEQNNTLLADDILEGKGYYGLEITINEEKVKKYICSIERNKT